MPVTRVFGWPYERPDADQPGVTLHGGLDGSHPILAEEIERDVARLLTGFRFLQRVIYTESGSFVKANYPGLRMVRVVCQAGGGAGGGAVATSSSERSAGRGGGGGEYAESWLPADILPSTVTVTVGAGGEGVPGAEGLPGGDSSFGTLVVARGGPGGVVSTGTGNTGSAGTSGGTGGVGDLLIPGGEGGGVHRNSGANLAISGEGGNSVLGHGGKMRIPGSTYFVGSPGTGYGGGGGGAANLTSQSASVGGDGAPGIVIVDIYV